MTLLCTKLYKLSHHKQNKNSRPDHHAQGSLRSDLPVEPNLSIPLINLDQLGLLPLGPLSFCLESLSPREPHSILPCFPLLNCHLLSGLQEALDQSLIKEQLLRLQETIGKDLFLWWPSERWPPPGALVNFKTDGLCPGMASPPPSAS